jgi:DNA helicase-4
LLLGLPKIRIELRNTSLAFASGEQLRKLPIARLTDAHLARHWPWCTLTICVAGSERAYELRGLPARRAAAFLARLQVRRARALVEPANRDFEGMCARDAYVRHSQLASWKERYQPLEGRLGELVSDPLAGRGEMPPVAGFLRRLRGGEEAIARRNDEWVVRELERRREWFDAVERHPLTLRQREAIVRDEDASLVVAGPGTGKTSTVIAKVAYLLARGVPAGEILVLSFSRKTVAELGERAAALLDDTPTIGTFHALGLGIIAEVEGQKPSLSRVAEDERKLHAFLKECVDALLSDAATAAPLRSFLIEHLRPERSAFEFESKKQYIRHLRCQDLRSYQGERVKSQEELIIANWLYCQGIAYEYEAKYEVETATRHYAQYRPDFFLPEYGIYIEHFGVARDGRTAPWIDAKRYRESMEWKRALHRENGTELVESYSYEHREGRLLESLDQKLRALGVEPRPIPEEELRQALERRGEASRLVALLASFLNLFKSSQGSLEGLRRAAGSGSGARRALQFLDVFGEVLRRYESQLAEAAEIDFHDMIVRAVGYVRQGRYVSPFRHIIVDEFQDIAQGRSRLLKALVEGVPDARVFCVGDDCQSIYRFTGSDVAIMTQFESHFGFTRRTELDQTFRLNAELLELSSAFIGRNPAQLPKHLEATRGLGGPAVTLWIESGDADEGAALRAALEAISEHAAGEAASVLLIGRYNFSQPAGLEALLNDFPRLAARFVTAHGSKGLEADYSVVLDVVAGRHGFPSEVTDDPLLDLLLASREEFPNAEERRLFYVALTRARRCCHVLSRAASPSAFASELREGYDGLVEVVGDSPDTPRCSECGSPLVRRSGPFGEFWGCVSYPWCGARPQTCPACGHGAMLASDEGFRCSASACGQSGRRCPQCQDGMLVTRTSQYGEFVGCSNYLRGLPPCAYREPL